MFIIYGTKKARIKRYKYNQQCCKSCQSFDLNVKVYREYFHVFFIPIFPKNYNTSTIRCNNCGEPLRLNSVEKHYESTTKAPFYLYSGILLFMGLILSFIVVMRNVDNEKAQFVANPKVGDVFSIRKNEKDSTTYYFLRLIKINGDTLLVYHNNLDYYQYEDKLSDEDFFVKNDELIITKKELTAIFDKGNIYSIERSYGNDEGFNRIK